MAKGKKKAAQASGRLIENAYAGVLAARPSTIKPEQLRVVKGRPVALAKLSGRIRTKSQADLDRLYTGCIQHAGNIASVVAGFSSSSVDVTPLINAWNSYVAFLQTFPSTIEFPNTPDNQNKINVAHQKQQEARNSFQRGDDIVFNNFVREVNLFETRGVELESARSNFESRPGPGNDLPRVQAAMDRLLIQNKVLGQYWLVAEPRTDQQMQRVKNLVQRFQRVFFVDEVDRLRQEYITYAVAVPARGAFTKSLSGSAYSFAELNFGEYSYAILNSRMLQGLAGINQALGSKITVTSCYRNPHKQVSQIGGTANSQHCYGTAVDLRTSNNQPLWTQVAKAACQAAADWVEPPSQSTYDHVHADWRGQQVSSSWCKTGPSLQGGSIGLPAADDEVEPAVESRSPTC